MLSKRILLFAFFATVVAGTAVTAGPKPQTLPVDQRPAWLRQEGIVMAGSWEPLPFRVRRDGSEGYTPTPAQRAAYEREHSAEMIARLKALGVNFVMMHCYKGGGREAERESMADAVRFAKLCHDNGLRVGVYVCSGAFLWELFFKEVPEAETWVIRDARGERRMYGGGRVKYRYFWNRNHPDATAFYRNIVRFAVEDIKTDLIHFDNYTVGPGYDANSVSRFRGYLDRHFAPEQLRQMGVSDPRTTAPPKSGKRDFLAYAWDEFRCRSLADSYRAMSQYARTLRPDILLECNPGGVGARITAPIDHGRLLQGGEAFWDEGQAPGYQNGRLSSRIRTYKVARCMDNMAFCYTTTPLEMAESMAFNRDSLGAVCWFEYDKIARKPGMDEPVAGTLAPFIRFFHGQRGLLGDADVVADIAVLRSFPSQVFGRAEDAAVTSRIENALIESRACFQILYDHQLNKLRQYTVLVLAGCAAMSDEHIGKIRSYVEAGGRLCIVGPAATHDEWLRPRQRPGLAGLPDSRVVRVATADAALGALGRVCNNGLSLAIDAPPGLCTELTEQAGRRMVHYVNYRSDEPAAAVATSVRVPTGRTARSVTLVGPQHEEDLPLAFTQQHDAVTFTVPRIAVYEIAVIALQ